MNGWSISPPRCRRYGAEDSADPAQQQSGGFDRIFVYGTRGFDNAGREQTLTSLLDAHHFTDGLALVPQGAPTKNTPDASSAYSSKDPDSSKSFGVERQAALTTNPAVTASVFEASTAEGRSGTAGNSGSCARTRMARRPSTGGYVQALWPATLGYFLDR